MFIFGLDAAGVRALRDPANGGYEPRDIYLANPELRLVLDQIGDGRFAPGDPSRYQPLIQSLLDHGDYYLLLADYAAYIEAQRKVDALFADPDAWTAMAIRNVAKMGPFSSDRTITEYATEIWRTQPVAF
jgi:starch phosphorylase